MTTEALSNLDCSNKRHVNKFHDKLCFRRVRIDPDLIRTQAFFNNHESKIWTIYLDIDMRINIISIVFVYFCN